VDNYIIIKNGLVLTLDRKGQTGYFNIIIKNNKIFLIDYEKKFNEKKCNVSHYSAPAETTVETKEPPAGSVGY